MKYIFIPFGFFPIYLVFKVLGFIAVLLTTIISFIWGFNLERTREYFWSVEELFTNMTLNPFYAWYHFLDGLEELTGF